EMATVLNFDATIDASAFSAAEIEAAPQAESTVWRVTSLVDGAEGSLRWAVAKAQDGDSIRFDPTLAGDDGVVDIVLTKGEIVVDKDIAIDGYGLYHFENLEGLIYDQDHTGVKISAENHSRIFNIAEGADVRIVGVHMTEGSVRKNAETGKMWEPGQELPDHHDASIDAAHDADHHGGALHVPVGAKLTLEMCVVSNSKAIQGGGAAAVSGEFYAFDTIFENNHGGVDHGGAIRIFDGFVEVQDCYFRDNTILPYGYLKTTTTSGRPGRPATTTTEWVDNSSSTGGGGAVAASGGAFRSFNSAYTGNSGWYGAAIHVNGGKVLLSNNLIVENGGEAYQESGQESGGYKFNRGCYNGGGVDCDGGTLTIVNTTIANNVSAHSGSGLYVNGHSGTRPTVNIYNSIIANNESKSQNSWWGPSANNFDTGNECDVYGYYVLTDFDDWTTSVGIVDIGQSDKIFVGDSAEGYYRYNLGPNSPAANVGSDEYASIFHYDETAKDWVRTEEKIKCDFVRNERQGGGSVDLGSFERDADPYRDPIMRPENVVLTDYNLEAQTVVVSWDDKSYNELGFRVEISTDGKNWSWVAQTAENVASTTLSGIEPNKTYYVRVRAEIELSNVSEWSDVAQFIVRLHTLDEPAVSAEATSSTEIAFYVGEVENAVGYVYEYSANPDFSNATRVDLPTFGMTTISGLQPYTRYYFRAYAVGTGLYLDSPWNSTYATTEKAVLVAPTPGVALTDEETTLELSFDAVPNATSYVYRYSTSADFSNAIEIATTEAGTFEISGLERGKIYYFQTKAIGGGAYVDSDWSNVTTSVIDLPAPNVSAEATGTTTIEVTVDPVPHATTYYYRYATTEEGLETAEQIELDGPGPFEISGLDPNTTYYVQVYAAGDGEAYVDSAWSKPVSATTEQVKLAPPSVSATPVDASTITFGVGSVANADEYLYEYSTSPDFANSTTLTSTELAYDAPNLSPYTTYYFRAKAVADGYEASEWSVTVSATTPKFDLAAPAIETVATSSSEIVLTIGAVERATGYYCEYSTDPTFRSTNTLMATPGTFTLTGLSSNSTYYFRVLAYGGPTANISAWSTDDATTLQTKLAPPTPTLELGGSRSLKFTFDAVPNATKYEYRYATNPDFNGATTVKKDASGSFTHSRLSAGQTYYFQVKAVGDGDKYLDSEWSNVVSATTSKVNLPAPPVAIQTVGSTTLSFNFDAVANASSYEYRYATTQDGLETATAKSASAAGTFELTGLSPVTTYYVQVRAIGNGTNYVTSEWSTAVDATTVKIVLDAPEVDATTVNSSTLTFEIGAVENADFYVYEYSTSRYFTAETTVSGTTASVGAFNVDGLSPFTTCYFRAKAVVDAASPKAETHESSAWSTEASATTAKAALPAPKISAVALDTTTLALTIEPVANAAGYAYLMSTDPTFADAEEISRGSGTLVLADLTPGATYYFKAMATADANDPYNNSAWSAPTSEKMQIVLDAPAITPVATGASTI
ncbi:MAG: fibronectin type III domain-containing protein, partial [Thermoguttaceae bacterium]|nr:fibronectin type III domain-containing protein [Thermoguttaceae bacterium]